MPEDFASEFQGLPEYFVSHVRLEHVEETDWTRIYYFSKRGGLLCPLGIHIYTPLTLMRIAEQFRDHGMHISVTEAPGSGVRN